MEKDQFIQTIKSQITAECEKKKYSNICHKIKTEAGMDYVVNRAIFLMDKDNMHLGPALAVIDEELDQ